MVTGLTTLTGPWLGDFCLVATVLKTLINLKNKIQSQPEPTWRNDQKTDFEKRCSRKSVIDCNNVVGFFTVEIHGSLCIIRWIMCLLWSWSCGRQLSYFCLVVVQYADIPRLLSPSMITSVLSAIQVRYALFYSYFNGGSGERGGGGWCRGPDPFSIRSDGFVTPSLDAPNPPLSSSFINYCIWSLQIDFIVNFEWQGVWGSITSVLSAIQVRYALFCCYFDGASGGSVGGPDPSSIRSDGFVNHSLDAPNPPPLPLHYKFLYLICTNWFQC